MLAKRIIPCLDVTGGRVVKGVNFVNLRDAGDPVELADRYNREGADELLTFFTFPKAQWKTLRTTNVIERLHEEFRRRVKRRGRCRARTPPWSCSSASWRVGRSSCAESMAGGRSPPCSVSTRRWRHERSRVLER